MRILLTGAFGNVGSHTLPELVRRGHEVRCLSRLSNAHRKDAAQLPKGADVVWGSITDPAAVARSGCSSASGGITAARCITASTPATARATAAGSVMEPQTTSAPFGS